MRQARGHCEDVEFSCEDASRSEFEFLCRILEAVIDAGAGTVNLPDTIGYGEPGEYEAHRAADEHHPEREQGDFLGALPQSG